MLRTAKKAALKAGKILLESSGHLEVRHKKDKDLVTNADISAEDSIVSTICEKFPEHNILCEERGLTDNGSEYTWVVDPLDGTHNYVYGLPFWGVSIAVARDNVPIVGVLYSPSCDEMVTAERGKGAFLDGNRLKVSGRELGDSLIFSGARFHVDRSSTDTMQKLIDNVFTVRMLGVAVTSFSFLAQGKVDGYVSNVLRPWDYAAGWLVTEESGGKMTDFDGKALRLESANIVASNGGIHDELLRIINK